jgi:predicted RNA-binding Zn ribbon-like protein
MPDLREFKWVGGQLALDFSNTCEWYEGEVDVEWLGDYARLVEWLRGSEHLHHYTAVDLIKRAAKKPEQAAAIYADVGTLRDAILAICIDRERDTAALATINRFAKEARATQTVFWAGDHFVWEYASDDLRLPMWILAEAAAALLTSDDFSRVHQCAADDCSWLFVDTSRTGKRRWCDMATCGNRAKARRHYNKGRD